MNISRHNLLIDLLLFLFVCSSSYANSCFKPEITLIQKIEYEGFHREIRWLLERNVDPKWVDLGCVWALQLNIPKEVYLDPDQIAELNYSGALSVYITGKVDVESVAHVSTEHTAYIFVNNTISNLINIPMHLRYQRAAIAGDFGKAILPKPSVLIKCPELCSKKEVKAPCDVTAAKNCTWRNVTYQALFDEAELLVPVGDLDDYPLVSIVTLLLGCAGCIYTLSILSTTPL